MLDTTNFADVSRTSMDSLLGLSNQALEGVEKLSALNLQVTKTMLAECAEAATTALSAKSPEDLVKLQSATLQAAPQKVAAYARQVQDIFTAATAAQRAAVEAQVADVQAKFVDAINGALKNAPGTENTMALVKTAFATANTAYDGVNKAAKQVTDAVAENVKKLAIAA